MHGRKIGNALVIILTAISCHSIDKQVAGDVDCSGVRIVLPEALQPRSQEFESNVCNAIDALASFAGQYGYDRLVKEPFMDSVMIFDRKRDFDVHLLQLAGADTSQQLPETYCGALERRTLLAVTPEIYASVYPEGIEDHSYEKLLTHELAHRLHIRILGGDEEAMGPVWFYEGFALFAAGQFVESDLFLSPEEIEEIIRDPERGNYRQYAVVFRKVVSEIPLTRLIREAKSESFHDWVLNQINKE